MVNKIIIFAVITVPLVLLLSISLVKTLQTSQTSEDNLTLGNEQGIKYFPIGDSYTIGNGVSTQDRWPNVLVEHLNEAGVQIQLIGNPAVSGFTVKDAIEYELPKVKELQPDLVTVLIGANDNFRQTSASVYEQELSLLLDQLQASMKNPQNIVLVTLPDYSYAPAAQRYDTEGVSERIEKYNDIIKLQAQKRGLGVVDILPASRTMTDREDYISDGLHPSASGYRKWEEVIFPVVLEVLK